MIIRVSAKLGKKIHVTPRQWLAPDANPFADWSTHLFTAVRMQYILITNTASLYSMIMYGKGISNSTAFQQRTINSLSKFILEDGHEFIFKRLIEPATSHISFSKALNRGVIGSMNDLINQAQFHLIQEGLSTHETYCLLNEMPMSYLKYENPRKAFLSLRPGTIL